VQIDLESDDFAYFFELVVKPIAPISRDVVIEHPKKRGLLSLLLEIDSLAVLNDIPCAVLRYPVAIQLRGAHF